jgi:hypothetical protein
MRQATSVNETQAGSFRLYRHGKDVWVALLRANDEGSLGWMRSGSARHEP